MIKAGFQDVAENAYPTKHDQHEIHFGFQFGIRVRNSTVNYPDVNLKLYIFELMVLVCKAR